MDHRSGLTSRCDTGETSGERFPAGLRMNTNTLIPLRLAPSHLVCLSVKRRGVSVYTVDLERRTCNCPDHRYRGGLCKHLLAAMGTGALPAERLEDFVA